MKNKNLTTRFAVYSLLAMSGIGIITALVLYRQVSNTVFKDFVDQTIQVQRMVVLPNLRESDFSIESGRLSSRSFDRFIRKVVLSKNIKFIKIYAADGTVLYNSNKGTEVGKKVELKGRQDLGEALSGRTVHEVSTLDERPASKRRFLEIYSPIKIDGKIAGAFETYYSMVPVTISTRNLFTSIAILLTGGVIFLWFTLNWIIRGAARTITDQNTGLLQLTEDLTHSLDKLQENYFGTMESLASAIEARDPETGGHSHRVEDLIARLCHEQNLSNEQELQLKRASALHDVGKIGVPEAILMKPGALDSREWEIMKQHSMIGYNIIRKIPFLSDIAPIVKHHHENFDGTGYPDGLAGDDIPIEARILSIIDAFDAMTSDRPYRSALSEDEAATRLAQGKGTQFDPDIVEVFLVDLNKKPDRFQREEAA